MSAPASAEYLDLLLRASKVRHYLAKNPGSTYADVTAEFFPMKIPMMWLLCHGYVVRLKNPNPLGGSPIYKCKPFGVLKAAEVFDEADSSAPEAVGESDEFDI